MGTRKAPCYQLMMGAVRLAVNHKICAAQGHAGLSWGRPSLQADSRNVALLEWFVSGLAALIAVIAETGPS